VPVRRADGHVHEAPNLRWTDVALGERLGAVLQIPILVGNDAEFGAVAEHLRGAARGASDVVYISADVGVGGGVIAEGSALRGGSGYVGEIGHMVIRPDGRPCYCGSSGCWETEVGEAALCRALGLAEDTNARFHFLTKHQRSIRLSTAFDGPTLYGLDSDTDRGVFGKVGEGGVAIDTIDDME